MEASAMRKHRRQATAWISAALIASALAVFEPNPQTAACLVTTAQGDVQGITSVASCTFLGIPFAAPPLGSLRWRPPQPAAAWATTLNATTAAVCPQITPAGSTTTQGTEDCLKLNIWTPNPAPTVPVPVVFWIHTGAFQGASGNLLDSRGRNLVERTGAIVVAANYRLGPFGFLGHSALTAEDPAYPSSANYGFLDQRAAMVWVRDHIAAFGGDPDNVTIAGQSAGGNSVSMHLVSPGSAGLFTRAIMLSSYASNRWATLAEAEAVGHAFAANAGCTDPAQVLACMRGRTQMQVLLAFGNGQQEFAETSRVDWGPVVDGLDIPDQPRALYESGVFNRVPLIIGATRDEGWIYVDRSFPGGLTAEQFAEAIETEFGANDAPAILANYPIGEFPSPKHALSQIAGDVELICEARRVARLVERTGTPVYMSSFEREVQPVAGDQVIHGLDRNFIFGNNFGAPSNYVLNADDLMLFGAISGYWSRFAAVGDPNTDDATVLHWPRFTHPTGQGRGSNKYIVLDWPLGEAKRLREQACDFWEPFFLRSIADGPVPAAAP
jgi:para-nitrobenzyl esterase